MTAGGHLSRTVLKGTDTIRLANLIRRLGSEFDGEVLATIAALRRTLASAGHCLHDLADVLEAASAPTIVDQQVEAQWRGEVEELLRQGDRLTDWEWGFVWTVARYRKPPSAKQLNVLERIRRRLEEGASDAA